MEERTATPALLKLKELDLSRAAACCNKGRNFWIKMIWPEQSKINETLTPGMDSENDAVHDVCNWYYTNSNVDDVISYFNR